MVDLRVASEYPRLSAGFHEATIRIGDDWLHAKVDSQGRLIINRPGEWRLYGEDWEDASHSCAYLTVSGDGHWSLRGDQAFTVEKSKVYFGFAIADGMFPPDCTVRRRSITVDEARERIAGAEMCLNPSHVPTIAAAVRRYDLPITVPERAPLVALAPGDRVIVMSVRGLPRREGRTEYTAEEINAATFVFGEWEVL